MLGTSYFDVYKKAITEFKDPTIKNLFETDIIMFSQVMYNFLENAISLFTNPIGANKRINDRNFPTLESASFIGDGVKTEFEYDLSAFLEYKEDVLTSCTLNGENEIYTVDWDNNKIIFDSPILDGETAEFTIYYVGNWNINLYNMEEYILSQFIMSAWSEYIQNDKLDIVRLLGDTDFKLTAVSTTTSAKSNWNIVNRETVVKRMNKYAWDSSIQRIY